MTKRAETKDETHLLRHERIVAMPDLSAEITFPNHDPRIHFYLDGTKSTVYRGSPIEQRTIGGMSGAGIWRIIQGRPPMLVGIQTAVQSKTKLIRGNRFSPIIGIIGEELPELRPSLSLLLPAK